MGKERWFMRDGISRRGWLLGLLTGLGGWWLRRLGPASAGTAGGPIPPRATSPRATTCDPLGQVTTYTYDAGSAGLVPQERDPLSITTIVYDSGRGPDRSPG
jgi:hypothetical protein